MLQCIVLFAIDTSTVCHVSTCVPSLWLECKRTVSVGYFMVRMAWVTSAEFHNSLVFHQFHTVHLFRVVSITKLSIFRTEITALLRWVPNIKTVKYNTFLITAFCNLQFSTPYLNNQQLTFLSSIQVFVLFTN